MNWPQGVRLFLLTTALLTASSVRSDEQTGPWLMWDYPLAWQPLVAYEATITSVRNGQAVRQIHTVVPTSHPACQVFAATQGYPWTADTLCAAVCPPAGETTVTLVATTSTARSGPSNEAHDLVTVTCGPSAPPPPPSRPSASSLPSWAVGAGAVAISGTLASAGASPPLPELVNRQCVTWRITGPCFCNPFTPCVQVEYWEPTSLIEIVKHPGTTTLPILGDMLKAGLRAMGVSLFGGGGAGNASGSGHTNLQYAEAHVWSFPQIFGGPCTACAPVNALPILQYASEADAAAWRTTRAPLGMPPLALLPVGSWGTLFPRGGFVIEPSAPVASGLQAFRALNIAFQPVTIVPAPEAHVVVGPSLGLSGCLQLAAPKQTPCLPAGTPGPVWDKGAVSPNGSYVWLSWTKRTCCVEPSRATCGITLPGIGSDGANMCPL